MWPHERQFDLFPMVWKESPDFVLFTYFCFMCVKKHLFTFQGDKFSASKRRSTLLLTTPTNVSKLKHSVIENYLWNISLFSRAFVSISGWFSWKTIRKKNCSVLYHMSCSIDLIKRFKNLNFWQLYVPCEWFLTKDSKDDSFIRGLAIK